MLRDRRRSRPTTLLVVAASLCAATAASVADERAVWTAPPVDVEALRAEDTRTAGKDDTVPRVGFPMKADIEPARVGSWTSTADGDRVWRVSVRSPGALWIVLGFGTFRLEGEAELRVSSPDGAVVHGPYTADDVRAHGQLWVPPIPGDRVDVELVWPRELAEKDPNLHLGTVSHGYEPWGGIGGQPGGDPPTTDAGSCNVDVNCPLGDGWQDQKRGVVNLLEGGSGYCSGSLITNANQDCRQLVLTANHCLSGAGDAASTVFQFNFERPTCGGGLAPTDQTVSGSTLLATFGGSDFTLLEMDEAPPASFEAFYNGWSRSTAPSAESWSIHHPRNDEKAISYNADPLIDGQNYGPDHWRITEWEQGTTEPGSSGSPLFDVDQRIIGQLHGGTASCSSITWDEYGKFDVSWDGGNSPATRLRDVLDPWRIGYEALDGVDATTCAAPQPRLYFEAYVGDDSAGNGNGVVEPGERVTLEIDALNDGTSGATEVSGTISPLTAGVTIVDGASLWPDIASAQIVRSTPPHVTVDIDAELECGATVRLRLDMAADEGAKSWASSLDVPTGTPEVTDVFFDDVESGSESWTVETIQGDVPWNVVDTDAFSGTQSWFVEDVASIADSVLRLDPLSSLPANAELRFVHRIDAESGYDGGVLEYSADGGPWTDAGSLIREGGYTSTISTSYQSPIAGRDAWSGDNGDWQRVRVDLSSLAGRNVELRWRFAADESVGDVGWWIDDVVVDATEYLCDAPSLDVPGEASGEGAPFTIAEDPGGYLLRWSEPLTGGPVSRYVLYRTALGGYAPSCEADLGSGTETVLATLPANRGFLVVARNDAGEGSYGSDAAGNERAPAATPCP